MDSRLETKPPSSLLSTQPATTAILLLPTNDDRNKTKKGIKGEKGEQREDEKLGQCKGANPKTTPQKARQRFPQVEFTALEDKGQLFWIQQQGPQKPRNHLKGPCTAQQKVS